MKLKKLFTKNETNIKQYLGTKNVQSKSCREFWMFSIERRAGRGCSGCCLAGGFIISEKHSSSSIVMGFLADLASSEILNWLSHTSRASSVAVVRSHMLRNFLHHLHFFKLVLCHEYLCHIMLEEIPSHHFHHVPDLDWDVHSCQENSRDCFSHLNWY